MACLILHFIISIKGPRRDYIKEGDRSITIELSGNSVSASLSMLEDTFSKIINYDEIRRACINLGPAVEAALGAVDVR